MFIVNMPLNFKQGDSAKIKINGDPAKLTWRGNALVINDTDVREVQHTHEDGDLRCFVCADATEVE